MIIRNVKRNIATTDFDIHLCMYIMTLTDWINYDRLLDFIDLHSIRLQKLTVCPARDLCQPESSFTPISMGVPH